MSGFYYYVRRGEEIFGPALPRQLVAAAGKGIVLPSDELAESRDGPWYSAATCVDLWQGGSVDSEGEDECFIAWEGPERSGPYSKRQLRALWESDHLSPNTYVADIDGRLSPLAAVLGISRPPEPPRAAPRQPIQEAKVPESPPAESRERSPATPRLPKKKRRRKKTRPQTTADSQQLALQELLSAELASPPLASEGPPQTAGSESQQQLPPRSTGGSASDSPAELTFIKTIRSRIRSDSFRQAYLLVTILLAVQSAAYLAAFGALSTKFLLRISSLAIEVFIPFGSGVEELQEADLVAAGIASVLICAELLLPLFFLLRGDMDFRLWAIATLAGAIVALAITADGLTGVGTASKWAIAVCGFGIAAGGVWVTRLTSAQSHWLLLGLFVSAITAGGAGYSAVVKGDELLTFELAILPPYLEGESIALLAATGLSLLAVWLAVPLYCLHILSTQADESTRSYISFYLIKVCALGCAGVFCVGFLGMGTEPRYLSVPLALLPMTLGAAICSMSQPVMWVLQPDYTVR